MGTRLPPDLLARLAQLAPDEAIAELTALDLLSTATATNLAAAALLGAESEPVAASRWLAIAQAILATTGANTDGTAATTEADILYAQARLQLMGGDLPAAEASLREARSRWSTLDDQPSLARSALGLTQLLTVQGRYAEAEELIRAAVVTLSDLGKEVAPQRLDAQHNLATLLSYQERHAEALVLQREVRTTLAEWLALAGDAERAPLETWLAQVEMAIALSLAYLDNPTEAERSLSVAIDLLTRSNDDLNRGRARTNLGNLHGRTGQFARALQQLDLASLDLLGVADVDAARDRWPRADVLFLEQALVYLSLNLLSEAATALSRAQTIFRQTGKRYELGQALYYAGLLAWQHGDVEGATASLAEAAALFAELDNLYWLHHVRLAQAGSAYRQGNLSEANQIVDELQVTIARPATSSIAWDRAARAELELLRVRLSLAAGDLSTARQAAGAVTLALNLPATGSEQAAPFPHLQVRLHHTLGLIERAAGAPDTARQHFTQAIDLLEAQRATLPLEELRTAFLADKTAIYADLVLSLLDAPAADAGAVAEAFAVVERARSRALLERLLATLEEPTSVAGRLTPETQDEMAAMRRQLYWLYNQLLGTGGGSRHVSPTLNEEIRTREAALQHLEWQAGDWLAQAEPAALADLQATLDANQQALVYFLAGDEVMAFVITQHHVQVVRQLCTAVNLSAALAALRFQLGRVEIGDDYVARHRNRLLTSARTALHRLYQLVIEPLYATLVAERLLVIPYGPLHVLPFHALWDGTRYMLETFECAYASSASVAVHIWRQTPLEPATSLAALALHDAAIPQAEAEVQAAATYFDQVALYLDQDADFAGMQKAAQGGDLLHIATHGIFRPDNPFFSALKLADGWIDVRQIYRLPLRARIVVLSACESGAVQVQGSDEAIGLARGFLAAGAETMLVSIWNVHDASAAQLMDHFYSTLTRSPTWRPAAALRAAQRASVAAGRHPYFWAPYVVIGG